jgi:hypothetical protein
MITLLLILGMARHASAQVTPPVDEDSLPKGAVSVHSRIYFSEDWLESDDAQMLMFMLYEMESKSAAVDLYDNAVDNSEDDATFQESDVRFPRRTDDASLWNTETDDGEPMSMLFVRDGKHIQVWFMSGKGDNEHILADLYRDHFRRGYDEDNPFPDDSDVPDGMVPMFDKD